MWAKHLPPPFLLCLQRAASPHMADPDMANAGEPPKAAFNLQFKTGKVVKPRGSHGVAGFEHPCSPRRSRYSAQGPPGHSPEADRGWFQRATSLQGRQVPAAALLFRACAFFFVHSPRAVLQAVPLLRLGADAGICRSRRMQAMDWILITSWKPPSSRRRLPHMACSHGGLQAARHLQCQTPSCSHKQLLPGQLQMPACSGWQLGGVRRARTMQPRCAYAAICSIADQAQH